MTHTTAQQCSLVAPAAAYDPHRHLRIEDSGAPPSPSAAVAGALVLVVVLAVLAIVLL